MANKRKSSSKKANGDQGQRDGSAVGPLYRVTRDPDWLREALTSANHLFRKASDGSTTCVTHNCPAAECVPPVADACVWRRSLDGGLYTTTVIRVAPYRGLFTLTRDESIVAQQHVGLMYNAEFGPDGEDVRLWEEIGIAAADNDYRRRGEKPPS